jgi:hypothetical protein
MRMNIVVAGEIKREGGYTASLRKGVREVNELPVPVERR